MAGKSPITVAYGDGIGPEIMKACLEILEAGGALLELDEIKVGKELFLAGNTSGIEPRAWESLERTGVFYKAPITTPQGGGYKSINVTMRKRLGLYANVRPVRAYYPYAQTKFTSLDIVIVRENEEDLYAGIEHRQTEDVYQTLKLITRPGTEKIVRYAFEYARANQRRKVTCFTKDNIMKMTDGLFHQIFDEIAAEYPEIQAEHMIIDIGAAKAASRPELFDVILTPNLYGDIVSDIVAEVSGSIGLAGSANIGQRAAMFEAVHGSAPDIAGQGIANPSGLLLAGVMMLVHLGQTEAAEKVHNAWLRTIEDGVHTRDIYKSGSSKQRANTHGFALAVIDRLGQRPLSLKPVSYAGGNTMPRAIAGKVTAPSRKELVGVDVFFDWEDLRAEKPRDPAALAKRLEAVAMVELPLESIGNRGLAVWPNAPGEVFCTDHWRCRFKAEGAIPHHAIVELLARAAEAGLDFIKTENLYTFDGEIGYSLGQGE
jgi:isocitrate dehydrogenase